MSSMTGLGCGVFLNWFGLFFSALAINTNAIRMLRAQHYTDRMTESNSTVALYFH